MNSEAYEQALRFLGPRFLSRFELETKLARKGYDATDIREVIDALERLDYINDQRLSIQVARLYMKDGKYGVAYMKNKMLQRGLEPPHDILQEYDEGEAARHLLVRKQEKGGPMSKEKSIRFLLNRGFSPHVALTVWQALST